MEPWQIVAIVGVLLVMGLLVPLVWWVQKRQAQAVDEYMESLVDEAMELIPQLREKELRRREAKNLEADPEKVGEVIFDHLRDAMVEKHGMNEWAFAGLLMRVHKRIKKEEKKRKKRGRG